MSKALLSFFLFFSLAGCGDGIERPACDPSGSWTIGRVSSQGAGCGSIWLEGDFMMSVGGSGLSIVKLGSDMSSAQASWGASSCSALGGSTGMTFGLYVEDDSLWGSYLVGSPSSSDWCDARLVGARSR
jgi:hypothetical protein